MSFLENITNNNILNGLDKEVFKDIVLNLDVSILMLNNNEIEYINPAGEALISRINGCSKEDYDFELCAMQIKLLLEQGLSNITNSTLLRYSYITAINGSKSVFYIRIYMYKFIETDNRLIVRFEDYTDTYLAEELMNNINKANSMISKITSRFLSNSDRKKAVYDTLREIGLLIGADRVYILEKMDETNIVSNTTEWCNNEVISLLDKRKDLNTEDYRLWINEIEKDEKIWMISEESIPRDRINDREYISINNIDSVLFFPLKIKGETIGFLGADNISKKIDINNEINKIVRLACRLITSFLDLDHTKEVLIKREIMLKDISSKSAYEEKLEERNIELKETLTQLREIQNQMIQQEKMAGIGQLAAGIAHEINNPLGYVMSNFDTLKKYIKIYDEFIEELLDRVNKKANEGNIHHYNEELALNESLLLRKFNLIKDDMPDLIYDSKQGIDRIHKIITGLRMFSRKDDSENIEEYDINEGIENTLLVANNEIKYYAKVIKNFGQIPSVKVIPVEINQVFINIIVNAVSAIKEKTPDNQGTITINTFEEEEYVCCTIEDTGTGISPQIITEIFNPFFTTKPVGQGTGLGLSISYDIINNKHHGKLEVQSNLGEGTVFTIKLPK